MFKITIIDDKGKKRVFTDLPSLIGYANSFQMSWLPDGFSWYIQGEASKKEETTEIKKYSCKFDCSLWFDKNFEIEARSQKEADQKAKELMGEIEHDMFSSINPVKEPNFEKLKDWTFGDLSLHTVHVEEN